MDFNGLKLVYAYRPSVEGGKGRAEVHISYLNDQGQPVRTTFRENTAGSLIRICKTFPSTDKAKSFGKLVDSTLLVLPPEEITKLEVAIANPSSSMEALLKLAGIDPEGQAITSEAAPLRHDPGRLSVVRGGLASVASCYR